jgi:poly-gamma-glutamate synthesis protein (capsule biosynthesis protein)
MVASDLAANDENAFSGERGITNVLSDVGELFNGAKVVPIIFETGIGQDRLENLAKTIFNACDEECMTIASVDFSHYQPGALAEIHDSLSIRALVNSDKNLLQRTEVDSNESLSFTMSWAQLNNTQRFHLEENTNSGLLNNDGDAETTSYVLGWYEKGEPEKISDELTFMIGGDMMFDRNIDYHFRDNKIFDVMSEFGEKTFQGTDLSMANLEGPISDIPVVADNNSGLVFNFPPKTPDVLSWLGINAVSLANNHTLNRGQKGLAYTKSILTEKDIAYVGQDGTFNQESVRQFDTGSDYKLTVIALDVLNTDDDLTSTIEQEKKKGNLVMIVPHWGVEYEPVHHKSQEILAHKWIDAGADFVIGGHPHVIQDAEIYKSKPIFYSLGNLLFDQDFSKETQRGLVLAFKIKNKKLEIVLLPTVSQNYKPKLLTGDEKTTFLSKMRNYLKADSVNDGYGYDKIEIDNFLEGI